jgi:hypothetical protein
MDQVQGKLELLIHGHIGIVKNYGILSLTQWTNSPVRVNIVPHFQVIFYLFNGYIGVLGVKFFEPPFYPYGIVGRHEYL